MKGVKNIIKEACRATDYDNLIAEFARLRCIKETIPVYVGIGDLQNAVIQQLKDSVMQAMKDSMEEAVTEAFEEMSQAIRTQVAADGCNGENGSSTSGPGSPGNSNPPPVIPKGGKDNNNGDASAGSSPSTPSSGVAKPSQATPSDEKTGFVGGFNSGSAASSDPSLGGQAEPSSHMHVPEEWPKHWKLSFEPDPILAAPSVDVVEEKTNFAQTKEPEVSKTHRTSIPPSAVVVRAKPAEPVTEAADDVPEQSTFSLLGPYSLQPRSAHWAPPMSIVGRKRKAVQVADFEPWYSKLHRPDPLSPVVEEAKPAEPVSEQSNLFQPDPVLTAPPWYSKIRRPSPLSPVVEEAKPAEPVSEQSNLPQPDPVRAAPPWYSKLRRPSPLSPVVEEAKPAEPVSEQSNLPQPDPVRAAPPWYIVEEKTPSAQTAKPEVSKTDSTPIPPVVVEAEPAAPVKQKEAADVVLVVPEPAAKNEVSSQPKNETVQTGSARSTGLGNSRWGPSWIGPVKFFSPQVTPVTDSVNNSSWADEVEEEEIRNDARRPVTDSVNNSSWADEVEEEEIRNNARSVHEPKGKGIETGTGPASASSAQPGRGPPRVYGSELHSSRWAPANRQKTPEEPDLQPTNNANRGKGNKSRNRGKYRGKKGGGNGGNSETPRVHSQHGPKSKYYKPPPA